MDRILRQIQRIYSDDGGNDRDFSVQEEQWRQAQQRLTGRTKELAKAAENLNRAALSAGFTPDVKH